LWQTAKPRVLSVRETQWFLTAIAGITDSTDQDGVRARIHAFYEVASEQGGRALNGRLRAALPGVVVEGIWTFPATCESIGEFALLMGEDADREMPVASDRAAGWRIPVDADEQHRRLGRDRYHGTHGYSQPAANAIGCDDRNTVGRIAHRRDKRVG
jgi:hypothetical protein